MQNQIWSFTVLYKIVGAICVVLVIVVIAMYFVIEDRRQLVSILHASAQLTNETAPSRVGRRMIINSVEVKELDTIFDFTFLGTIEQGDLKDEHLLISEQFKISYCNVDKIRSEILGKGARYIYKFYSESRVLLSTETLSIDYCTHNA